MLFKLCFFFIVSLPFFLKGESLENLLQEANANYLKGEKASSFEEQKQAFNQALFLYFSAEKLGGDQNSAINEGIANSFFQLNEYPWSILYTLRALKYGATSPTLKEQLSLAQQKLGLTSAIPLPSWQKRLLLSSFLSFAQKCEAFFWLALMTLLAFSATIWLSSPRLHFFANMSAILTILFLGYLAFSYYHEPIEGIVVHSTGLYQGPQKNEIQLSKDPLLIGSKVQILETTREGNWTKIRLSDGVVGFIPASSLRLI